MSTTFKNSMREVMSTAWQFVRKNGYSMSEAMKVAWANYKLKQAMKNRIVRFYYRKVSGEVREAFGSLQDKLLPPHKLQAERLMIPFSLTMIPNVKAGDHLRKLTYYQSPKIYYYENNKYK